MFRFIPDYPHYQVSDEGIVRRIPHNWRRNYCILKPQIDKGGYYKVSLYHENKMKHFLISRLVAKAFISNPLNLPEVNHKDGDKSNNHVSNLEWSTRSHNMIHAFKNGLAKPIRGEDSVNHKLTNEKVLEIRKIYSKGLLSMKKVANLFKVNVETIHGIIHKRYWSHI